MSATALALYVTLAFGSALLAVVLLGLQRVERRRYLAFWTASWAALSVHQLAAAWTLHLVPLRGPADPLRLAASTVSLVAVAWHVAWLAVGAQELSSARTLPRRVHATLLGILALLAVGAVLATLGVTPQARFAVRVGLPAAGTGVAFLAVGVFLARRSYTSSFGSRLLISGLVLLGARDLLQAGHALAFALRPVSDSLALGLGFAQVALQGVVALGMVAWHHDEERARAQAAAEALQRSERQLRATRGLDLAGRMAASVAHDFGNLITVVRGFADLAAETLPSEAPQREHMRQVREAARSASELVSQLLAVGRQQPADPRPLDVDAELHRLEPMLRRAAGERCRLELARGSGGALVHADPLQLEQVLLNLVLNARDAMPEGGPVRIRSASVALQEAEAAQHALPAGRYVELLVRDEGEGMDDSTRLRVFEPFFTTKPEGAGTGLGLASVYGIVQQLGGAIRVESARGRGSSFRVLLPRLADAPRSPLPAAGVREGAPPRT